MNYQSDRELLKACIEGDPAAGDCFVEHFSHLIFNSIHETLRMYCSDYLSEDIEDIHNSIFASLFKEGRKKLGQFRGDNNCSLASWLRTIAINTTRNFISRNRTFISLDSAPDEGNAYIDKLPCQGSPVLDRLIDSEEVRLVNLSVKELKAEDRLVLKYFYKEGLPPEEIANIMNIAVNTVYSRISRIKKRLGKIVKEINLMS